MPTEESVRCSTGPRRDLVDVAALVKRFGLERLCEVASEKDSGFTRSVVVDMLGSFRRFAPEEFSFSKDAYENLARSVEGWRSELGVIQAPVDPPAPEVEL